MKELTKIFKKFLDDESIDSQYKWMVLTLIAAYNNPNFPSHGNLDSALQYKSDENDE